MFVLFPFSSCGCLCLRIGNQVAVYRTCNGSFGVIHRGEATLLSAASLQVGWHEETSRRRKENFRGERVCAKEQGVTKVCAREDVSGRISSHSSDRGRTVRPPRPFSISLLRHSSTAAFNDRAVEKGRGTPARPFLLLPPSSFRRAWQKATNGADLERKECSRRLNWLGNGWFIARFSTADPQSATPPTRERHEKVWDSPTAFSHAREWIVYLYPVDAPRTRWSRVNASKRNRAKRSVDLNTILQYYLSVGLWRLIRRNYSLGLI